MSRKNPEKTPPVVNHNDKPGWITETRKYKVITPLYGGGEETQKADSVTVVRATEVRGHLRFWWRATRGGMSGGSLAKMKQREDEIWGSAGENDNAGSSGTSVRIVHWANGRLKKEQQRGDRIMHIAQPGADWSYVAFPLRESRGSVLEDVAFELEIRFPDQFKEEIEAALWAWETFGGIGARTRRGFGALQCVGSTEANMQSMKREIQAGIDKYVTAGVFPNGVPHLSKKSNFQTVQKNNAITAWEYLFKKLRDFRQARPPGQRPGRSLWSEPDKISRLTGTWYNPNHVPRHPVEKFPRAKFGLPIIFKFKDDGQGDPQPTTLQGARIEGNKYIDRLASPLILRPIACSDGALGLAAILEWEPINSDES